MKNYFALIFLMAFPSTLVAEVLEGTYYTSRTNDQYLEVLFGSCAADSSKTCGIIQAVYRGLGKQLSRPELEGKLMVWDLQDQGSGIFKKGQIWNPSRDRNFKLEVEVLDDTKIQIKGCLGFLCREQIWTASMPE